MSMTPPGSWLDRPLASAFLRFNLLPNSLAHESQQAAADAISETHGAFPGSGPAIVLESSRLLRHASAQLLRSLSENELYVQGLSDPALPVFMAPTQCFERLTIFCGLVVLSLPIRRVIVREERERLRAELSQEELAFARLRAPLHWADDTAGACLMSQGAVREQALRLGQVLLVHAADAASPPVACRARLRLPVMREADILNLPATLREGATALMLSRSVLQELDPEWLTLFPDFL